MIGNSLIERIYFCWRWKLHLFDLQGQEIRRIDINTFAAFDLVWSNVLNAFLIAGYNRLLMYNVEKDQLIQIEKINLINKT